MRHEADGGAHAPYSNAGPARQVANVGGHLVETATHIGIRSPLQPTLLTAQCVDFVAELLVLPAQWLHVHALPAHLADLAGEHGLATLGLLYGVSDFAQLALGIR